MLDCQEMRVVSYWRELIGPDGNWKTSSWRNSTRFEESELVID
jgi:hypothetical protein